MLSGLFSPGDICLHFFQLDSHFAFPAHIYFSLGTFLFYYVSIPIVFIAPLTSVSPANFINSLFPHHVWFVNLKRLQLKNSIIQYVKSGKCELVHACTWYIKYDHFSLVRLRPMCLYGNGKPKAGVFSCSLHVITLADVVHVPPFHFVIAFC